MSLEVVNNYDDLLEILHRSFLDIRDDYDSGVKMAKALGVNKQQLNIVQNKHSNTSVKTYFDWLNRLDYVVSMTLDIRHKG